MPESALFRSLQEGADSGGDHGNRLGEDHGQNAGHAHLHRQRGGLTAVHLTAHLTLGILHRDAALCVLHESDQNDQTHNAHHQQQSHPPLHIAADDRGVHGAHHGGNAGDDACEQDHGDTVADAEFGHLLTQPHNEAGASDEGHDNDQGGPDGLVGQDTEAVLHQHVIAPTLQDCDANGGITGNALDLLLALFAALTSQTLQCGDGDGQQLNNDGAVDVGLHTQGENGGGGESAAGHHIVQAQNGGAHLLQVSSQHLRVHIGHGDGVTDAEDEQHQCSEDDLLAQLGDAPSLTNSLDQLRSPLPFRQLPR